MTYGAVDVKFLDHADFVPLPAKAETLDVPIDIHPNWASPTAMDLYDNDVGDPPMGRVLSGVFDRHPRLQIICWPMGESLPFLHRRFGDDLARVTKGRLEKPVQQYFHDRFWITTSAFLLDELLAPVPSVMGEDRVMFSADYPFVSNKAGAGRFRAVDLPRASKEKIAHGSVERLFGNGPF